MDIQMRIDTTYIDLSKSQIKELHQRVFGETVINEQAVGMFVKLELTYIPFFFFIVIMVLVINTRWKRTYNKIIEAWEKLPDDKERAEKIKVLKEQNVSIADRLIVYLTIWGSSLFLDGMLMFFGIFNFPWISIPVAIGVVYKKLKKLTQTSSLQGIDDSDLLERFDTILNSMVLKPITDGVTNKLREFFNNTAK